MFDTSDPCLKSFPYGRCFHRPNAGLGHICELPHGHPTGSGYGRHECKCGKDWTERGLTAAQALVAAFTKAVE